MQAIAWKCDNLEVDTHPLSLYSEPGNDRYLKTNLLVDIQFITYGGRDGRVISGLILEFIIPSLVTSSSAGLIYVSMNTYLIYNTVFLTDVDQVISSNRNQMPRYFNTCGTTGVPYPIVCWLAPHSIYIYPYHLMFCIELELWITRRYGCHQHDVTIATHDLIPPTQPFCILNAKDLWNYLGID